MERNAIDFNGILAAANLVVFGLLAYAFVALPTHEYVDQETKFLALLLSIQTQVALFLERRHRDPFVILLAFSMILYYALRIFTLTLYPYSGVFGRYPYDAQDSNFALTFILVSNLFLYGGFFLVSFTRGPAIAIQAWRPAPVGRVVFVMLAAIVFGYFSASYWTPENVPRVFNFLTLFLGQHLILLMALTYYFLFRRSIGRGAAALILLLILLELGLHTLSGSRSAIVGLVQSGIMVLLALYGSIRIPRRYVILGVLGLPVVIVLLVGTFAISTYNRANRESATGLDLGNAIEMAGQTSSELSLEQSLDTVLPLIFSRAGFFDFSAEIIAHREEYAPVINLPAYGRSLVDNLLTPGFDLYDQPKISNALLSVYGGLGPPSKSLVYETYQSDQLGLYGEAFVLLGYACLPLMFVMAYLMKRIYVSVHSADPFTLAMKRIVVLFVFVRIIDSFGVDWTIIDTLPLVAALFLYSFFFASRRPSGRTVPQAAHV